MKIVVAYGFTRDPGNPGFCDIGRAFTLGLRRLGHQVYVIDEVTAAQCCDSDHQPVPFQEWKGIRQFEALARSSGVWPRCCLIHRDPVLTYGMTAEEIRKATATSDLLLIVGGTVHTDLILENARAVAYVDINPAKTRACDSAYSADCGFHDYDHFFTVGLNIGSERCGIPTSGVPWRGMVQPVVLDLWQPDVNLRAARFTTISSWADWNACSPDGKFSGEKSDQWSNFIELPRHTKQELEIALEPGRGYEPQIRLFERNGWRLGDARRLRHLGDYQAYIAGSRAEFSTVSSRDAGFHTGWFSDRSARYLASGKPVLVQSTGFEEHLPTGRGLLSFRTLEEAADRIGEINRDYATHCRAARRIAEEYFDSSRVLTKMLRAIGLHEVAHDARV